MWLTCIPVDHGSNFGWGTNYSISLMFSTVRPGGFGNGVFKQVTIASISLHAA
jgi:hypothetical protein